MTTTRREFLGTGALGMLATGLAIYAPGASAAPVAFAAATTTRTVNTVKGPVKVPVRPTRIVAIQPSAINTLYDVGLKPIGVYDEGAEYISPRYRKPWSAATKVGDNGQVNVEQVATLHPDLIVGVDYSWNTSVYSQLSQIAPTVIAPATTWQAIAQSVADAVNRLPQLAALKKELNNRSAQLKKTYASTLSSYKWDILQGGFDTGDFWLYGPKSDTGTILAGIGGQFASASAKVPGNGPQTLSYEKIGVLQSADVIGYYAGYNDKPNNDGPQLFSQAQFKQLPAVKAGRLVPIPDFLPGGYGDALAILDELDAGLKKIGATR